MQNQLCVYCVDLDTQNPSVLEFDGEELAFDLKHYGVKDPLHLTTYDRKVFRTEADAEGYLQAYKDTLRRLKSDYRGRRSNAPCMLYKLRYLVQTLRGEKFQTYRHYDKGWKPGMIFQLHDQTHFLPVRLKKISKTDDGYKYEFTHI